MNHLQVTIAVTDPVQQEILIALLSGSGFEGFEQQEDALLAFLPEAYFDAAGLEAILRPRDLAYTTALLPPTNWNDNGKRASRLCKWANFAPSGLIFTRLHPV
jgi:ribosomal protein L11 methyltransferase